MAKLPLIGISCRKIRDTSSTVESVGARMTYVDSISAAGGVPVLLPFTDSLEQLRAAFDACDGILLPGGEDVDPALFHQTPHPQLGAVCRQRDDIEVALAKWAQESGKPLLGICRGLQVINVAFGGTLVQDIPSDLPNALTHAHDEGWEATPHDVALTSSSKLREILGESTLHVNSVHHQAIGELAPNLIVAAQSEDGVIEAVETKGKEFFIAVQWHPESLWQRKDPRWLKLFEALVLRAAAYSSHGSSPGT